MIKPLNIIKAYKDYSLKKVECSGLPTVFWIEPTNACNLRCSMCPSTYSDTKRGLMSLQTYKKIIDEIKEYALEVKLYDSGEPLLHKQIVEMIIYANKNGLLTEIDTNGTLLTPELSESIIKSGLDYISFSFDGYDAETYETIRLNGKFNQTLNNLITFLKIKKRLKSKTPFVRVKSIVKTNDKRFSEKKMIKFQENFKDLHVNEFARVEVHDWGGNKKVADNQVLKPEAWNLNPKNYARCPRLYSTLAILWNGDVLPCCSIDFEGKLKIGNVNEKSIRDIWNDSPIKNLRTAFINHKIDNIPFCSTCPVPYTNSVLGCRIDFPGWSSFFKRKLGYGNYRKIYNIFYRKGKFV